MLAATGLYGVLSYGVARRTNEIGIRMALGSGKRRVIGMILRETSVMIAIGLVAGAAAAAVCTRFIASRLYGLSALDPLTVFVAAGVLCAVALAAAYIPAARAARASTLSPLSGWNNRIRPKHSCAFLLHRGFARRPENW